MKFIPLKGYIAVDTGGGKLLVDGFAFEVPGFEYVHTWVTPSVIALSRNGALLSPLFSITQWESGLQIGAGGWPAIEHAARYCEQLLKSKGHEQTKAALRLDGVEL